VNWTCGWPFQRNYWKLHCEGELEGWIATMAGLNLRLAISTKTLKVKLGGWIGNHFDESIESYIGRVNWKGELHRWPGRTWGWPFQRKYWKVNLGGWIGRVNCTTARAELGGELQGWIARVNWPSELEGWIARTFRPNWKCAVHRWLGKREFENWTIFAFERWTWPLPLKYQVRRWIETVNLKGEFQR